MPQYVRPTRMEDALALLSGETERCLILAGGTDLVVDCGEADLSGRILLDVTALPELGQLRLEGETLRLGAGVSFTEIIESGTIPGCLGLLKQAAASIGSPQIRNTATVGGNLGTASPGGDFCIALSGLRAEVVLLSARGERSLPVEAFFTGVKKNRCQPDELIVRLDIRLPLASRYRKLGLRRSLALPILALGVSEYVDGWRIAMGPVTPVPFRPVETEALLTGGGSPAEAAALAEQEVTRLGGGRRSSLRGSVEYKRKMAGALLAEVLKEMEEDRHWRNR